MPERNSRGEFSWYDTWLILRTSNSPANFTTNPVVCLVYLIICVGRAVPCTEASTTVEEQERSDSLPH